MSHHFHHHPSPASRGSASSRVFSKSHTKSNTKKTTQKSRTTVARRRIPKKRGSAAGVSDSRQSAKASSLFFSPIWFFVTHFSFQKKVQKNKTLNSWGDTKEGKNLSKKKNGFVVLTLVHLIIHHHGESVAGRLESAVRHAARVRRAFAADEDDDDDDDDDCFSSSSSLFCFPSFLAARSCIIIFIVFRLSLFFPRVRLSSNRVRRVVLSLVFLWRGARRGQNRASSGGGRRSVGVGVRGDSRVLNANE